MALLSRFPIVTEAVRTFRLLRWAAMPGHLMPDGREGRPAYHSSEEAEVLRLSSKSHWDLPLTIAGRRVRVLSAHPTPGVFDGPEDANGRRNFDEIRLLADYVRGGAAAAYVVDDAGQVGGLADASPFVIMGDMNADPDRDAGPYGQAAIAQLLSLERVQDPRPESDGARQAAIEYETDRAQQRTSRWGRFDYVLPSRDWKISGSGVFWPAPGQPGSELVGEPDPASDHRLVWVDLEID
jgi:hypothetical protein